MSRRDALDAEIRALDGAGLEDLRALWRARFGSPPKLRSVELLRLLVAWRVQTAALGGLDRETKARLARRGPVEPEGRRFGLGAILSRTWQGRRIEVVVEPDGFRWEGEIYPSLSAVARGVTGTRWNGPRFFGLRDATS
ncbi:DUF2924 domain-containing protein [Defluviimonas sp. SAOS-178_SWC]|uniref:DUF2924 domain-containing protein n=1 Tax=Defluviimonas sp. SAOS-178_SWC TaxID=3121287 RepID=UPI0032213AF9